MTAQATHVMYRQESADDWFGWLTKAQRDLIPVPEWATDCLTEGWALEDHSWLSPDDGVTDARLDIWFSMKVERQLRAWGPDDIRRRYDLKVELKRWDTLIREAGQYRYQLGQPRLAFTLDDGDVFELGTGDGVLLLEAIGEALTPVAPATLAAVRAEQLRNLSAGRGRR